MIEGRESGDLFSGMIKLIRPTYGLVSRFYVQSDEGRSGHPVADENGRFLTKSSLESATRGLTSSKNRLPPEKLLS